MNWIKLKLVWRTVAEPPHPAEWNTAGFERLRAQRARTLARRDWMEAGVGFALVVFFSTSLVIAGPAAWVGWIGVILILAVSVFFVRERLRARRTAPPPEAPLLLCIESELKELRHQRRLLGEVLWWYLLPLLAALVLLVWGFLAAMPGPLPTRLPGKLTWFGAFYLGINVAIWWANRVAVRTWIDPQIRDLERQRESFTTTQQPDEKHD